MKDHQPSKKKYSPGEPSADSHTLRHIAIIMDGNGRWAARRKLPVAAGHKEGVERVRDILEACRHTGVEVLTLFAFSSENWNRSSLEVKGLMKLFSMYLKKETARLKEEGVRIVVIGGRDRFSDELRKQIAWAEQETASGTMTLALAVDYGGRWDIVESCRRIAEKVQQKEIAVSDITESLFAQHTCLNDLPPVDLLIRTSGELRISNFLLWQCAYSEFYFTDVLWPDFDEVELHRAFDDYRMRQRRFGAREEAPSGDATTDENYYV